MSEFITIQVGQCGNQIGDAFWPLALRECGINTSVNTPPPAYSPNSKNMDSFHSFFHVPEGRSSTFKNISDMELAEIKARAICIDMEDSVVARFRKGRLRNLFDKSCLITNYPGSGNNWAEGFYTHGLSYREEILNGIRSSAEKCDQLHGFLLIFSMGGGTGSGLGSATCSFLNEEFSDIDRFVTCVYPAGYEDVITGPYNVALATRELTEHATCVFPVHNKALNDICNNIKLKSKFKESQKYASTCGPFQDMNSIIVNMLLHLTSGSRFPGTLNVDVNELSTNLVPFPQLHFILSGYSPVTLGKIHSSENLLKNSDLLTGALSKENQLLKMDLSSGTSMAACLIGRGTVSLTDMQNFSTRLHKRISFVPWGYDALKVGLCSVPPSGLQSSLLSLVNTSAMAGLFEDIIEKFNKLYCRKAHIHHYLKIDGFERDNFTQCLESLKGSSSGYHSISKREPRFSQRIQVI